MRRCNPVYSTCMSSLWCRGSWTVRHQRDDATLSNLTPCHLFGCVPGAPDGTKSMLQPLSTPPVWRLFDCTLYLDNEERHRFRQDKGGVWKPWAAGFKRSAPRTRRTGSSKEMMLQPCLLLGWWSVHSWLSTPWLYGISLVGGVSTPWTLHAVIVWLCASPGRSGRPARPSGRAPPPPARPPAPPPAAAAAPDSAGVRGDTRGRACWDHDTPHLLHGRRAFAAWAMHSCCMDDVQLVCCMDDESLTARRAAPTDAHHAAISGGIWSSVCSAVEHNTAPASDGCRGTTHSRMVDIFYVLQTCLNGSD